MVAHVPSTTITRYPVHVSSQPSPRPVARRRPLLGATLWGVQILLALLFLFAGGVKFTLPIELLEQGGLPSAFILFIGAMEVLGALGLLLPGLTRLRPGLTPLAAVGLVIIMVGASTLTAAGGAGVGALFPLVVGLLVSGVAYGRWRVAPHRARA